MKTQTCGIAVDRGQPDILTWLLDHPWVDADMLGEITFEVVYEGVEVRMATPLSWCLDRPEEVARLVCSHLANGVLSSLLRVPGGRGLEAADMAWGTHDKNMWVKDFEAGMGTLQVSYPVLERPDHWQEVLSCDS